MFTQSAHCIARQQARVRKLSDLGPSPRLSDLIGTYCGDVTGLGGITYLEGETPGESRTNCSHAGPTPSTK